MKSTVAGRGLFVARYKFALVRALADLPVLLGWGEIKNIRLSSKPDYCGRGSRAI